MCKVDVFDHPRFCDEFSHVVKRFLLQLKLSVELSGRWFRCFRRFGGATEVLHSFCSCQYSFSSVEKVCEVDVFEHPRFRDEFSLLVKRHFVPS